MGKIRVVSELICHPVAQPNCNIFCWNVFYILVIIRGTTFMRKGPPSSLINVRTGPKFYNPPEYIAFFMLLGIGSQFCHLSRCLLAALQNFKQRYMTLLEEWDVVLTQCAFKHAKSSSDNKFKMTCDCCFKGHLCARLKFTAEALNQHTDSFIARTIETKCLCDNLPPVKTMTLAVHCICAISRSVSEQRNNWNSARDRILPKR
jgi:hypothetical protein